ncbi:MAG: nicotinamide mononucleotide transporter [Clostridiales bacterium]|nr:nicotinamide mononucleotide transporter [Clostridiales bacterium]
MENKQKKDFKERCKDLWNYFTTYEKIWFFSILVLAIVFSFIFPETDDPTYTVAIDQSTYVANASGEYNSIYFGGTNGEFVLVGVTVGDKEYSLLEISDFAEFTIDSEEPQTLYLTFNATDKDGNKFCFTKDSAISLEFYQDSDGEDDQLSFTVCRGEKYSGVDKEQNLVTVKGVELIENKYDGYEVVENAQYPVAVWIITALYLADVVLNIACELLISKQSKWNFIVSLGVEIVEILVCILCAYRFATMAVTLLFWIPCDIISFVLWHRHPDRQKEELTVVKKLNWWQDILIVAGIAVWTVGIGYLLTLIEVEGGIFANNVMLKNIVCYIDACASAVGIANGLLILFRYREQWIAWYIVAILETVINIIAGQWVLLILKLGYLTNTTYGYIKWTQYIRHHKEDSGIRLGV